MGHRDPREARLYGDRRQRRTGGPQEFSANPFLFDLVITDQAMPQIPGSDPCIQLLRIRNDIPIILRTGHGETISSERAEKIGIREFLMKPVTRQELALAVRMVLDGADEE